jgi:hypothetical protein
LPGSKRVGIEIYNVAIHVGLGDKIADGAHMMDGYCSVIIEERIFA